MPNINFKSIAARAGSQLNAFEELCCQLARRTCPAGVSFERFRGAGGDGGVECITRCADGSMTGWQAKFVFDIDGLIAQANESLQTALTIHKDIKEYIVCFPFDPTGKTGRTTKLGRPAKSEADKLDGWIAKAIKEAKDSGRDLKIELWPASTLQSLLLKHDVSGGIRQYFFNETVLSTDWFKNHVVAAAKVAGPRYTPTLNVQTDLWGWFSAFEAGGSWRESFEASLVKCRQATKSLRRQVSNQRGDPANPPWPASGLQDGQNVLKECESVVSRAQSLQSDPSESRLNQLLADLVNVLSALHNLEVPLADELDAAHGKGTANSESFRRWSAEYQCSFPAANLDAVRDAAKELATLAAWLRSPKGYLAFKKAFILSGAGGSGKTHGICDMAFKRLDDQGYTCVLFGHQFSGLPSEWTRLTESLGLPLTIGKDGVLDALNSAGEGSGRPLIFCIDAVNETRPRDYWLHRYLSFAHEFEKRPFLKLCVSCRTSFLSTCLPQSHPHPVIEHQGFEGIERQACDAFFQHYELEPPLVPVLQPELSNPLYLKLVCETLKSSGLKRLPNGWLGLAPVIRAFLAEKEKQFASEHDISVGADIVAGSLLAIASTIADSGTAALPWSQALLAVNAKRPQAATLRVLEWLVKAELLIEDGAANAGSLGGENVLRPAFERFGDVLVASELLPKVTSGDFAAAFKSSAKIQRLFATQASVDANAGIILALSILLPEIAGVELPNLIEDAAIRKAALALTIRAIPWRTSDTFTNATRALAREALAKDGLATMDSLIAVSAQPSKIDSFWICDLLTSLLISKRDAFWCGYLHDRFEKNGVVKRLIEASADIDLQKLDFDTALRWAHMLLWFSAAADRRVKDHATRAAIAIFRAKSDVIPSLVEHLVFADDDEVRERVLLCSYGALITSRHLDSIKSIAENLLTKYQTAPTGFQNAIIRDHIRSIGELARQLGCLDASFDPLTTSEQQKSDWPLTFPKAAQVEKWNKGDGAVYYLAHSCLHDDFNHYSIGCLLEWMHKITKPKIGSWILKHIVKEFGIDCGACDNYDQHTAYVGGGGRRKPAWAERIGKKYQWIGLYRLASRLHDNVTREVSSWDPKPVRKPLILVEERKIDPTLSRTVFPNKKSAKSWWLRAGVDLAATSKMDHAAWIAKRDDIPLLETLLGTTNRDGQRWLVLTAFPRWNEYRSDREYNTPYRDALINLRSYLVPNQHFENTCKVLDGRNYFGEWLPHGAKWLYAFAGEYPWATACNTDPDWYLGAAEKVRNSSLELIHSSNEIVVEWEYDASLPESLYLEVPSKRFFAPGDLWWNGTDGFASCADKTVFFDPKVTTGGSTALLADIDDLLPRLKKIDYRLIWTMLGEKTILGDSPNKITPLCFSQMAVLNENGTVSVGNRLFHGYNENQGLAKQ